MKTKYFAQLVALSALWGASFLFIRMASPVFGPNVLALLRVGMATATLALLMRAMRQPWAWQHWRTLAIIGALSVAAPFLLFAWAGLQLPAGYSAILNATTPLMGVVIGALAFGERITPALAGGVLLGMAGVAVLAQAGPVALTAPVLGGIAACLVATACYGLAGFLTRRWITQRDGLDSRLVALGSQWGAVLALAPFALWEAAHQPVATWLQAGPTVWGAMLALGLLCTSFAYVLYFRLIADVGPVKALTVTFLIPLFGVAWGWLVLGEVATLAHAAGGVLIALALWLVLRPAAVPAPAPTPSAAGR